MAEEMPKWEYKVQTIGSFLGGVKDPNLESLLNEWGEQGWEVVGFRSVENSNQATVIAKRPLTREVVRMRSMPRKYV